MSKTCDDADIEYRKQYSAPAGALTMFSQSFPTAIVSGSVWRYTVTPILALGSLLPLTSWISALCVASVCVFAVKSVRWLLLFHCWGGHFDSKSGKPMKAGRKHQTEEVGSVYVCIYIYIYIYKQPY